MVHVDGDYFLALGDMNDASGFGQGQRLGAALFMFARIQDGFGFDGVLLKEPLSSLARRSTLAMIHPINLGRHARAPFDGKK
jgi:hypothetical protein